MSASSVFVCLTAAVVTLIAWLLRRHFSYWKNRGIPCSKPHYLYGNFKGIGKTRHLSEPFNEAYRVSKGRTPFAGVYMLLRPAAVVTDLNLAKNILIRDFKNFTNRGRYSNVRDDPLSGHLFNLDGTKWKNLRQQLNPAYTFGKMKSVFPTVLKVANELVESFASLQQANNFVGIKDILARYTTDVIGTCAFGVECNSLRDPNVRFRAMSKNALYTKNHSVLVDNLITIFPKIATFLRMRRTSTNVHNFFINLVKDTVEYREKNNIQMRDVMNILMNLKKDNDASELQGLSVEEMAAQAYVFFLAGFETSSTTMGFCLYELALNQEIQDRLRAEIVDVLEMHKNDFSSDCLKDMKYLQMVIYETLRKYPVVPYLNRISKKDYQVEETKFVIEKGTQVIIPVLAIQRDPEVYPNPEVFDPERFSAKEVESRHPMAWLSFGDGPRICLGYQFGKIQVGVALALLLREFKFSVCPQTDIPLKFGSVNILLYSENDIVLKVEKV